MSPKYQLYYFNFRGRAEVIRLLFKTFDVEFEDIRVKMEEWATLKPTIKGGKLPALKITDSKDGSVEFLVESMAIARYFGKKFGVMGDDNLKDYYLIERMIGLAEDLNKEFIKTVFKTPEETEKVKKEIFAEAIPSLLQRICDALKETSGDLTIGENRLSLADLVLFPTIEHVDDLDPEYLKGKYPEIHAHRKAFLNAAPKLENYLKTRPITLF